MTTATISEPKTRYTYTEAAARLGVSERTLHRWVERGLLKTVRHKHHGRRITVQEIERFEAESNGEV